MITRKKKIDEIDTLEINLVNLLRDIQKEIELADDLWDKACRVAGTPG